MKFKKILPYLIAPVIVVVMLLVIFLIKGIYPFGTRSIAIADMAQGYVPIYTHLWDVIHSGDSMLYNFNLGSGSNIYGSWVLNVLYSPIAWLVALTSRDNILGFFSIFLIIKTALMALTSFILFNKVYKNVPLFYKVIFSVMYGLSGYVLIGYSNIMWLDVLVLFPLLILALKKLFDDKVAVYYIIVFTLCLIFTFYVSYMLLLFVIFSSILGIIFCVKKEDRKVVGTKFLFATLLSLTLSLVSFLPAFMQSNTSYRIASLSGQIADTNYFFNKLVYYTCSVIPLILFIKMLFNYKKDKKITLFYVITFLLVAIGLIVEPINKMWHTGSYSGFPYRYGFIPLMVLLMGSLHYLNLQKYAPLKINKTINKKDLPFILGGLIFLTISIVLGYINGFTVMKNMVVYIQVDFKLFLWIFTTFISFLIAAILILKIKDVFVKRVLIVAVVLLEILIYGIWYIGFDYRYVAEIDHTDIPVKTIFKTTKEMNLSQINNSLYRYKDDMALMSENYPLITNTPSISSWIHIITEDQMKTHRRLGYSTRYTRLQDLGGSLFTDSLLNIRYVLTNKPIDDGFHTKIKWYDNISLYEKNYNLPFGIINSNKQINLLDNETLSNQNEIYHNLFNKKDDIIYISKVDNYKTTKNKETIYNDRIYKTYDTTFTYDVSCDGYLYLNLKKNSLINEIKVNDQVITIPTIDDNNNTTYITRYNSGLVNLGYYKKGKINIVINHLKAYQDDRKVTLDNFEFGLLDINKLKDLTLEYDYQTDLEINKNTLSINVDSKEDGYLFLPITYDKGFTAYLNGKKVDINKYLGTYMNIKIAKGENKLVLKFIPPYLDLGIKISLISLVILLLMVLINKKFSIPSLIYKIGMVLYIVFVLALFYIIYIKCLF